MNNLNQKEISFWNYYIETIPEADRPKNPCITAGPAGTLEGTDKLIDLYLQLKKQAGSSVVEDFRTANDPLPKVGDFWILLDSRSEPVLILITEKIEVNKFVDIPQHVATAEGEGDSSIGYWKQVHSELFTPYIKEWGINKIENATIITEYFKIVYKN